MCYLAYFLNETMSREGQFQFWGEEFFQFWIRYFDIVLSVNTVSLILFSLIMSRGSTAETSGCVRMNIRAQIGFRSSENVKVSGTYFFLNTEHIVLTMSKVATCLIL